MKKVIVSLVSVAFLAVTIFSVAFAADVPESFEMKGWGDTKPPVPFPHKKHSADNGIKCKECHHKMASDDATPKACKTCHKATEENDVGGEKVPAALHNDKGTKNIFHDRCRECHKKEGKGPEKCKECHIK